MIVKCDLVFALAIILISNVNGSPVNIENAVTEIPSKVESVISINAVNHHETTPQPIELLSAEKASLQENPSGGDSEETNSLAVESEELLPDNAVSGGGFDSSVYPGYLSPDAFQQYISQYGMPPYVPYPAPIGYAPPPLPPPPVAYPSPYVVQSGYEGYLVPSSATTAATTSTTTTAATDTTTASTSLLSMLNPMTFFSNILGALMSSIFFRIIGSIFSGIAMYAFGNILRGAICNFTPLCQFDFINLRLLRNEEDAKDLGRMIAEGMTPERVRRATELVQNAILKYHQLQKMMTENDDYYDKKNI